MRTVPRTATSASSFCGGTPPFISAARADTGSRSGYSAVMMVLTSAERPSATSTATMCVPVVLIGSVSWIRRLSSLTPRACRTASAISCAVTEPNSRPSSPAWWAIVRTVLRSRAAVSSARSACSVGRPLGRLGAPLRLRECSVGGRLGQLSRHQVVAQVARGDVDDFAALAECLDRLEQDRLCHEELPAPARGERGRRMLAAAPRGDCSRGSIANARKRRRVRRAGLRTGCRRPRCRRPPAPTGSPPCRRGRRSAA